MTPGLDTDFYGSPDVDLDPSLHSPGEVVDGSPERVHHQLAAKVVTDHNIRCGGEITRETIKHEIIKRPCKRLLAIMASRPWEIKCPRCDLTNKSPEGGSFPQ